MTLVREIVKDAAIGVGVTDTPDGLSALHSPDCAAVIWRRHPLTAFQDWIDAIEPEQLPKARVILRPDSVRDVVTSICAASGTPDCSERGRLIDDVAALAVIFAGLTRASFLRLRLDVVTPGACQKFHIDPVTTRLICTYRGTGMQYGLSQDGGKPSKAFTVPTGAPIVLQGTRWLVSPPIEGVGETRLVLVLDPVEGLGSPAHQLPH